MLSHIPFLVVYFACAFVRRIVDPDCHGGDTAAARLLPPVRHAPRNVQRQVKVLDHCVLLEKVCCNGELILLDAGFEDGVAAHRDVVGDEDLGPGVEGTVVHGSLAAPAA